MQEKRLILIRHGESEANNDGILAGQEESRITQRGIYQAERAAEFLKSRYTPIDLIYSSPLSRALTTAKKIQERLLVPVVTDDDLIEMHFGKWEGLHKDDLRTTEEWDKYIKNPLKYRFPEGESCQIVRKRVEEFKNRVLSDDSWKNAVVVSHFTPILFFILLALGIPETSRIPVRIDNGSISIISYRDTFELVEMINFVP